MPRIYQINGARYVVERWTMGSSSGWGVRRTTPRALRGCPGHYSSFGCAGRRRRDILAAMREDAQHEPGGVYFRP